MTFEPPNPSFRHHGVVVESIALGREFYRQLGFSSVAQFAQADDGFIKTLSGGAWTSAVVLKLVSPCGIVLELIEPTWQSGRKRGQAAPGEVWSHVSLTVEDVETLTVALSLEGGTVVGGPVKDPSAPFAVAYLRDPFGNLLELVQDMGR